MANSGDSSSGGDGLWRGWLIVVAVAGVAVGVAAGLFVAPRLPGGLRLAGLGQLLRNHVFLVLSLMPGTMVLGYRLLRGRYKLDTRRAEAEQFRAAYQAYRRQHSLPVRAAELPVFSFDARALDSSQGSPASDTRAAWAEGLQYVLGAIALAVPFLVLAALSTGPYNLGIEEPAASALPSSASAGGLAAGSQPAPPAAGEPSATPEDGAPQGTPPAPPAQEQPPTMAGPRRWQSGLLGLVFAGYGVFIYTLLLLIQRMNASALSAKFLYNSCFRAISVMLLGFVTGFTGLASSISGGGPELFLYFSVGLFPAWAYDAIRKRGLSVFSSAAATAEPPLRLELIDGLNPGLAEMLEELGISDMQHLATTSPDALSLATLYPLRQTLDWVNQAVLATHLRERFLTARRIGLRTATDLYSTWLTATRTSPTLQQPEGSSLDPTHRSQELLRDLARLSGLTPEAIHGMGEALARNELVVFFLEYARSAADPTPPGVRAISLALARAVGPLPELPAGKDTLPLGLVDRLLAPDSPFKSALTSELATAQLEWKGSEEQLRTATSYTALYTTLLQGVAARAEPRPARSVEG